MAKLLDVAHWFLSRNAMTHKKLQKLCYYAQVWYCTLYDGDLPKLPKNIPLECNILPSNELL